MICRPWKQAGAGRWPLRQGGALALVIGILAGCDYGIEINKLKPDAGSPPACRSGPSLNEVAAAACEGVELEAQTCVHPAGDWSLLLPRQVTHTTIAIEGAEPGQAAVAVDWTDMAGEVAGLVISRAARTGSPAAEAVIIGDAIEGSGAFATVERVAEGVKRPAASGEAAVAGVALRLDLASVQSLARVRNSVYPVLLGLDVAQFANLPTAQSAASDSFMLLYAVIIRADGRAIISGAVATLAGYESQVDKSSLRALDLANATAIGKAEMQPVARCETFTFREPAKVDLLWVVDGSDRPGMAEARIKLHQGLGAVAARARRYSVDLRMGVVSMQQSYEGKLCVPKPSLDCPDPGEPQLYDGTGEVGPACVRVCLLKPGGAGEAGDESYGLASAARALLGLLPRSANDPRKLRRDALTAVVYVSNVEDGSVKELFGGDAPDELTPAQREQVETHVKPHVRILRRDPDSGSNLGGTAAFALLVDTASTGDPDDPCYGRRGTGYIELVEALGGQPDRVLCEDQDAVDEAMASIIERLAPLASVLQLQRRPSSATLSVALDGEQLYRSRRRGFDYRISANSLVLVGLQEMLAGSGHRLTTGYAGW